MGIRDPIEEEAVLRQRKSHVALAVLATAVLVPLAGAPASASTPVARPASSATHNMAADHRYHAAAARTVTADSLYPEGVAWDQTRNTFLVSSSRHGTVSVVRPDNTVRTLIDDRRAIASYGLTVDAARNRLLVTYADIGTAVRSTPATTGQQSALGIYDLRTGKPLHLVDLALGTGPHAANDVAVDRNGNAYVTDTFGGTVFKIDTAGKVTG
ncbi:SMP-30/gluconolactonase/LRE family protein, partial [Actinoplanes sp. M2I2]|uniref:SMP-30/gluconolactonase/LRE family protein n=1 Tax=Actinoplanes sp. M2I2 TaxID=1734444 RepID=UPI00202218A0